MVAHPSYRWLDGKYVKNRVTLCRGSVVHALTISWSVISSSPCNCHSCNIFRYWVVTVFKRVLLSCWNVINHSWDLANVIDTSLITFSSRRTYCTQRQRRRREVTRRSVSYRVPTLILWMSNAQVNKQSHWDIGYRAVTIIGAQDSIFNGLYSESIIFSNGFLKCL